MRAVQEKAHSGIHLRQISQRVFEVLEGTVDSMINAPTNLAYMVREKLGAWTLAGAALVVLTGCPPGKQGPNQTGTSEASTTEIEPTTGIGHSTEPDCSEPTSNDTCSQMTTTGSPHQTTTDQPPDTTGFTETDPTTTPTSGTDTDAQCLEGIECFNGGECKVIDEVEQCVCPDGSCYKGGSSNCFDECADTCFDASRPEPNPASPDCKPCPRGMINNGDPNNPGCIPNPEALPPPEVIDGDFVAKASKKPFNMFGNTPPGTEFLLVSIAGGLYNPVDPAIWQKGQTNWGDPNGIIKDPQNVLPTYDATFYTVCYSAVSIKNIPSMDECVDVAGDPN